jgi:hypothetical protein
MSPETIDAMIAAGASAEVIGAAWKAEIEQQSKSALARRAKDAERQRKKRSLAESRGVTRTRRDKGSNDRDILTSKGLPPKPNGLDPKPKKHRLPGDWQPVPFTFGSLAAQTVLRWQPGRMERELAKFRDHHTAAGTQWENWQAAWSKWVNNSSDFERGQSGQSASIGKSQAAFAMLNPGDEPF